MTMTRSVASSTTPRSWLIRMRRESLVPLEILDRLHDSALHDDVQCRGRLVEHDQPRLERERERDRDALAHAAGQLVRVAGSARLLPVARCRAVRRPGAGPPPATAPRRDGRGPRRMSPKWRSTVRTGLSAFMPLCRTSANPLRRCRRSRLAVEAADVHAVEVDLAAVQTCRRAQHPGQRVAERGLAAARFADQTDEFALLDREVDVADRPDPLPACGFVHDVDAACVEEAPSLLPQPWVGQRVHAEVDERERHRQQRDGQARSEDQQPLAGEQCVLLLRRSAGSCPS